MSSSFHPRQNFDYWRTELIPGEGWGEIPSIPSSGACSAPGLATAVIRDAADSTSHMRTWPALCSVRAAMTELRRLCSLKWLRESVFAKVWFQSHHPVTLQQHWRTEGPLWLTLESMMQKNKTAQPGRDGRKRSGDTQIVFVTPADWRLQQGRGRRPSQPVASCGGLGGGRWGEAQ